MQPPGPPPPPAPPAPPGGYGGYGPPPQPPPYYGGPPAGPPPYGAFGPPPPYPGGAAPTEPKATLSLALGIGSLVCLGMLSGIPAIIVGVIARKRIAQSAGALGGDGMALAGIITGAVGSFLSLITLGFVALGVLGGVMGAMNAPHAASTAAPGVESAEAAESDDETDDTTRSNAANAAPATPVTVIDLSPTKGSLKAQLQAEAKAAAAAKQTLLVQTTATRCGACREIAIAMRDDDVAEALAGVRVVRVDIDAFKGDLKGAGLSRQGLPWFFLLDSALTPHDAISADEWDANVAENIAPVLGQFVRGTLKERRSAAPTEL